MIGHPPHMPAIAPAVFFLYRRVKMELAGISLSQESIKTSWDGVIESSPKTIPPPPFRGRSTTGKVCLNRQRRGQIKSQSNEVFKMINMKVILPCALVSNDTM
jgi:hypothetical protein